MKDPREIFILVIFVIISILFGMYIGMRLYIGLKNEKEHTTKARVIFYELNETNGDVIFKYRECKCFKENKE